LLLGGGLAAGLLVPAVPRAAETVTIRMRGDARGARVGFDPVGLRVRPGTTLVCITKDAGNSHTATAYAPQNFDRPRRIPTGADPWDSDYLLPDESFSVTLTAEGVYDYYCVPHEHAGMVGRIVVGDPEADAWPRDPQAAGDLPAAALAAFPPVEAILAAGLVRNAAFG
jgi:plastocyanin